MATTNSAYPSNMGFFTGIQTSFRDISNQLGISTILRKLDDFQIKIIYFCIDNPWASIPISILAYMFVAPIHAVVFIVGQTIALVGAIVQFLLDKLQNLKKPELSFSR